jgi:3',5'-cyclic AMP phosphodiesterase CpdA
MPKTIIHLSDLHIGWNKDEELEKLREICEILKTKYGDNKEDTVIIITGDIANDSKPYQFASAGSILNDLEDFGFLLWPLPGNHDYAPSGMIENAKKSIAQWIKGKRVYVFKYIYSFIKSFEDNILSKRKNAKMQAFKYPQSFQLSNPNITFIGLNSVNAEEEDFRCAQGKIGTKQLDSLDQIFADITNKHSSDIVVVALHHHPMRLAGISDRRWHQLTDGDKLLEALDNKVDILLFGHEHWHFYNEKKKIDGKKIEIPHILSCACSTNSEGQRHTLDMEGTVSKGYVSEGYYGWEISIENKKNIHVDLLKF